jgi:hypothetical protein
MIVARWHLIRGRFTEWLPKLTLDACLILVIPGNNGMCSSAGLTCATSNESKTGQKCSRLTKCASNYCWSSTPLTRELLKSFDQRFKICWLVSLLRSGYFMNCQMMYAGNSKNANIFQWRIVVEILQKTSFGANLYYSSAAEWGKHSKVCATLDPVEFFEVPSGAMCRIASFVFRMFYNSVKYIF